MSWSLERRSLRLGPVTLQFLCALQTIALPELSCVFVLRWSGLGRLFRAGLGWLFRAGPG